MRDHTTFRIRALAIAAALAVPAAGAVSVALSSRASAQVIPGTVSFVGHDVSAIEGNSKDFHVATVSGETLSNISVDWGDSSAKSTGAVDGDHVHAGHTYAEAGTYIITVNADATVIPTGPPGPQGVQDVALDSTPVTTTATATITDDVVNLHGRKSVVLPGGAFDGTVADGNDHNDAGSLSDFSAVIDWGDGGAPQPCTACIVDKGEGDFAVAAKHQYSTAGIYDVSTTVADGGSDKDVHPKAATTEVIVPIVASAVSGVEGTEFNGTVGSVLTPRIFELVARDAVPVVDVVSIDWGDGATSDGLVGEDGTVSASHTYTDERSYTITLTGSDVIPETSKKDTTTYSAINTVTVADAPLTGTPGATPFAATAGTVLSGVFGNVVDGNGGGPASDLSATIDWGDGSSSPATLSAGTSSAVARKVASSGGYNAGGSHTYTTGGPKNGVVHFVDKGGATANVPFTVNVAASQVQGITSSPNPSGGNPAGGNPTASAPGVSTPNTGADLPITTAALLVAAGGSLFAVGRRRRS